MKSITRYSAFLDIWLCRASYTAAYPIGTVVVSLGSSDEEIQESL